MGGKTEKINQNLHNVKCFHCVNLDFGTQRSLVSITDEVKPHVHKQTLYMKETHFLAIKIKCHELQGKNHNNYYLANVNVVFKGKNWGMSRYLFVFTY